MAGVFEIVGSALTVTFLILLIIVLVIIYYFTYISETNFYDAICARSNNPIVNLICFIYGFGDVAGKVPIGGYCVAPWNCRGWQVFGVVDCCEHTCVQVSFPLELCAIHCALFPSSCVPSVRATESGNIAHCNGKLVELENPAQSCDDFCSRNPETCGPGIN